MTKYTEQRNRYLKNQYVLLVAFYAYLADCYTEHNLKSDEEKQLNERVANGQLEVAARTILCSITAKKHI
jgi:hypothetical protein